MCARIGVDGGPLVRLHLIQGNDWCDAVIAIHHAIADGIGAAFLVRDLMRAIDEDPLAAYPMPPNLGVLRERSLGPLPEVEDTVSKNWRTPFRSSHEDVPAIYVESLDCEETKLLSEVARKEGTTIFGALAAALFLAARAKRDAWRSRPIRMLVPVDLRQRLGLCDELMLAVTSVPVVLVPNVKDDFWSLARRLRREIVAKTEDAAILQVAARSTAVWAKYSTADQLMSAYSEFFGFDILFTNVGRWPAPYEGKSLHLKAEWGPAVLVGFDGEQGISAATVDDELRLLHVSFDPEHALLKGAVSLLRTAVLQAKPALEA